MLTDSHCHIIDDSKNIRTFYESKVDAICLMSTDESDWDKVLKTSLTKKKLVVPAFGIHPWKVSKVSDNYLKTLESTLRNQRSAIIGEIGLDKKSKTSDLDTQKKIFKEQFNLAAKLNRPVSMHCVGCIGFIFELLSNSEKLPKKIMFHSFSESPDMLKSLLKLPCSSKLYFSYSYLISKNKKYLEEVVALTPKNQLLIESDLDSGKYQESYLKMIVSEIGRIKGWKSKQCIKITSQNFMRFIN